MSMRIQRSRAAVKDLQSGLQLTVRPNVEVRSSWIPGSYAPRWTENRNAFLGPLKKEGFKEERVTKVGLYAIGTSTTLESNKSHSDKLSDDDTLRVCCSAPVGPGCAPAGHTGLRASYALDIYHVIIQKCVTFAGP